MKVLVVNSSVMSFLLSLVLISSLQFGIGYSDDSPTKEPTEEPANIVTLEILFNGEGGKQDLSIDIDLDDIDCDFQSGIQVFEQACLGLGINFESQYFAQFSGYSISSIDGIESDFTTNFYWFLYVDGVLSNVGISLVDASLYSKITWSYEEFIFHP